MNTFQPINSLYKIIGYGLVAASLFLIRLLFPFTTWTPAPHFYTLWLAIGISLALFVGTLSLARFYARRNGTYLFIGIAYTGNGLLNAYHLFLLETPPIRFPALAAHSITAHIPTVWLGLLLAGSWMVWFRWQPWRQLSGRIWLIATAVWLLTAVYFSGLLLGGHFRLNQATGWATAVAAAFFLFTLLGYLYKRQWQQDAFESWLITALILLTGEQMLFTAFNQSQPSSLTAVSLMLVAVSSLCVFIGLLVSIITIFRQVESMAATQTDINETLQREIGERKRVETAEHRQRVLAEALREVGIALSSVLEFNGLLDLLLDQIARVMPYDTANVMLVYGDDIEIGVTRGYGQDVRPGVPQRFPLGRMPSLLRMFETGEPVIVPDTAVHELWVNREESPHVRSWAGAPISIKGEMIAFLALNNSQPNFYQPSDAAKLSAFASQAAVAFENARLYAQVRQRADELSTLNTISQAISSTLNLPETLTIITQSTLRLLHVEAASVVLLDQTVGNLFFAAASGHGADFVRGQRLGLGQGIIGWVVENGQPVMVPDTSTDQRHFTKFDEQSGFLARSILCAPLQTKGQTIGALEAINKEPGSFTEEDLRLLTSLAAPAATAIENAQLFAQAQQEIAERTKAERALEAERSQLARRVAERTADLSRANEELARAARLKDEFLASMSHELRTPLNAVLGISEALQEEVYGPLNENQIHSLHSIEESGRHLLTLINDILDLSKIEAGKLEVEMMMVSVEMVCEASLRLVKQNAHKKRLTVQSSFDSAVTHVYADERRLKQILVNLLSNAIKFTPEKGQVGLEVVGDKERQLVHITVWDTGIGIDTADIGRLFQPFVQLDSRLSREYSGTGLGLSLVQRMVDLQGGQVSVSSELGQGSRFTISFPWHADGLLVEAGQEGGTTGFQMALIVDDSPAMVEQVSRYLKQWQIEVEALSHGRGAAERAAELQPDFIILDILLPDISGWEILAQLQATPQTAGIPVIMASVVEEREMAMRAGTAGFLLKPIVRQALQTVLRRLLQQPRPLASHASTIPGGAIAQPTILLAEDNQANVNTFTEYLKAKGYQLLVASNGREAVDLAVQISPDLILMDIQMPTMNGLDAIREIRTVAHLATTPIIAVTALAMLGDEERCLAAGANAYLSKPVSLKRLLETIHAYLNA